MFGMCTHVQPTRLWEKTTANRKNCPQNCSTGSPPRFTFPGPLMSLGGAASDGGATVTPSGLPSAAHGRRNPADSKARKIAIKLLAWGTRRPTSKYLIVLVDTRAIAAKLACDQFNHARAALHCSGDIGRLLVTR